MIGKTWSKTESLRGTLVFKLSLWDEKSLFTISGIRNLTRSDIDTLFMCCDWYDANGNLNGLAYFSPEVKLVLQKYEML